MKVTITRFEDASARVSMNGRRKVFDLVPDGYDSEIVFHSIRIAANTIKDPEENTVPKTLLITHGDGVIEMEGTDTRVTAGDAVWLPLGSTHTLRVGGSELHYIVVRGR